MSRTPDEPATLPLTPKDDDTVRVSAAATTAPRQVRVPSSIPASGGAPVDRYELRALIGEGGMGEVHACRDRQIGREVAIKVIRAEQAGRPDAVARFEREARVQGQLEHPAVVPVYELSVDADGRAYFTMKRLRGRTLADVLDSLRQGHPGTVAEFSRRRLLAAFSQVCWAVEFAHSRGVLHRDIKPENVMFGDFGEVHLLDWGIATPVADGDADPNAPDPKARSLVDASIDAVHRTLAGEMVGTPGYMSPEQIAGDFSRIDERTDVFGLGAVLFEILTLAPLVDGKTASENLLKTIQGVDARAALRAPDRDVPPELEHVCIRATAPLEKRYERAADLRDAVERFLDGDRDVAKRRELSEQRVQRVDEILAGSDAPSDDARAKALRELSAAVALDPTNDVAQRRLARLLFAGPRTLPADAREVLDEQRRSHRILLRRTNAFASMIFPAGLFPVVFLGVHDWRYFGPIAVANMLVPVSAIYSYARRQDKVSPLLVLGAAMLATSTASLVYGPLVLVPSNVLAVVIITSAIGVGRVRKLAVGLGVAGILVPLALQLFGVLPRSYFFEGGVLTIRPMANELAEIPTLAFMTSVVLATILISAFVVSRSQRQIEQLEERLFLHAWNLRHLVPEGADGRLTVTSDPPPPSSSTTSSRTRPESRP